MALPIVKHYTFDTFVHNANILHSHRYNYTQKDEVQNKYAVVEIECAVCFYRWETTIHSHIIQKNGCPKCAKCLRWTLPRFLEAAKEIHGEKYNYDLVTEISGCKSKVNIRCNRCNNNWVTSVDSHINGKTGCRNCGRVNRWTLERLIATGTVLHENKYDYSEIKESDIRSKNSRVPVTCKVCHHKWTPTINAHINAHCGCPNCASNKRWNYQSFMETALDIHGTIYDYSHVKEEDVKNVRSCLTINCKSCNNRWTTSLDSHINKRSGCPKCAHKYRSTGAQSKNRYKKIWHPLTWN